ncbi:hypothetical protein AGDE_15225 [Angomonas deanei]|nr:hypothetical protein AGDE_15225 [Angomonas deanei]|eukprot:EPY19459.1 hypothetical protein AGDE_15225 [Angomonas deanei]
MKTDKKEESGESEGEVDEEEETPRENRKRGRVVMKKEKDVVHYYFQSDAKLLPFLYSFLLNCVDETDRHNNNSKAVKKEELLRHQKYRVVLPPALYTTMTDMLNASSYGTITL